jgi:hypothetical protein
VGRFFFRASIRRANALSNAFLLAQADAYRELSSSLAYGDDAADH